MFFSQLLNAASKLNKSGCSDLLGMPCRSPKAASHCMPFAHALVAALQLITSGWIAHLGIFCHNPKAIFYTIKELIAASPLITSCNAHFGIS